MVVSTAATPSVDGVCTSQSGWQTRGAGPSCTFCWRAATTVAAWPFFRAEPACGRADNLRNLTIPTLHQLHDTYRQDAAVYVFDDDPLDRQRSMLRKWAHRRRYVRLILANEYTGSERIQRLVVCRNTLVHEARQVLAARGVFLMLDLDCRFPMLVGGEWHSKWLRLLHGVSNASSSFGVLVSSNPGAYRDMWALRSTRLGMAYDCFWDF